MKLRRHRLHYEEDTVKLWRLWWNYEDGDEFMKQMMKLWRR